MITETTYDYYLMDAMGKTVAIFHSKNNDQGLVESWEYYASGAERECRLVPSSAQVPGANTSNTNVKFQKDQASFYLYDHLGNTRVTYTPTITTTLNQTLVLNNTFTGTTDGWSATSNTTISSVNNQLEVLTSNTTASVSKVIPFSANTDYSLSIDVAIESVGVPTDEPNVTLTIISGGNSVAQTTLVDGNNTLTFTSLIQPPTVAFVQINGTLTNYRVHLDNFIVSEVDATTEYSNIINSVVDYFPYGKVLREFINGDRERYLTTQHERDQETGLDYRGARYYDNEVGRFLSLDPLAKEYPSLSDYVYVGDNPIAFVDPDGKKIVFPNEKSREQARTVLKDLGLDKDFRINKRGVLKKRFTPFSKDSELTKDISEKVKSRDITEVSFTDEENWSVGNYTNSDLDIASQDGSGSARTRANYDYDGFPLLNPRDVTLLVVSSNGKNSKEVAATFVAGLLDGKTADNENKAREQMGIEEVESSSVKTLEGTSPGESKEQISADDIMPNAVNSNSFGLLNHYYQFIPLLNK